MDKVYPQPPRAAPAERKASKLSGWSGEGKGPQRLFASPSLKNMRAVVRGNARDCPVKGGNEFS